MSGPKDFSFSSVQLAEFDDQPPPLRLQMRVEFTTAANLSRVMAEGYSLGSEGFFCDRPNEYAILMGVRLYFRDQPVSGDVEITNPNSSGPLTYSTYMSVTRDNPSRRRYHTICGSIPRMSVFTCAAAMRLPSVTNRTS